MDSFGRVCGVVVDIEVLSFVYNEMKLNAFCIHKLACVNVM